MFTYDNLTHFRKRVAQRFFDPIYRVFPMDADEVTRQSGWLSILAALFILMKLPIPAAFFVMGTLALDAMDGAYARRQGKANPQIDWAMDRFTESVVASAILMTNGHAEMGAIYIGFVIINIFLPIWWAGTFPIRWLFVAHLVFFFEA